MLTPSSSASWPSGNGHFQMSALGAPGQPPATVTPVSGTRWQGPPERSREELGENPEPTLLLFLEQTMDQHRAKIVSKRPTALGVSGSCVYQAGYQQACR